MTNQLTLIFNGSTQTRPAGIAGYGFMISNAGQVVASDQGIVVVEQPTSHVATLGALVTGLGALADLVPYIEPTPDVVAGTPSAVIVKQVRSAFGVYDDTHRALIERARKLIGELEAAGCRVTLAKIPKDEGKAALELARRAIAEEDRIDAPLALEPGQAFKFVSVDVREAPEEERPPEAWELAEQDLAGQLGGVWMNTTGKDLPEILVDGWLCCNVRHRRRLPAWILDTLSLIRRQAKDHQLGIAILHGDDGPPAVAVMDLRDFVEWVVEGRHSYSDRGTPGGGAG